MPISFPFKRMFSLMLVMVMILGMFAGCGSNAEAPAATQAPAASVAYQDIDPKGFIPAVFALLATDFFMRLLLNY